MTDELVQKILAPGLLPGAVDVFLDFISYSGGPLPEELLDRTTVPVSILWGEKVRCDRHRLWSRPLGACVGAQRPLCPCKELGTSSPLGACACHGPQSAALMHQYQALS